MMLARKQAEVEIARDAATKSTQSSWWKWSWGGPQPVDQEKAKIMDAAELSAEEKKKLYDAIGYKEEDEYSLYPSEVLIKSHKNLLKPKRIGHQSPLSFLVRESETSLPSWQVPSGLERWHQRHNEKVSTSRPRFKIPEQNLLKVHKFAVKSILRLAVAQMDLGLSHRPFDSGIK